MKMLCKKSDKSKISLLLTSEGLSLCICKIRGIEPGMMVSFSSIVARAFVTGVKMDSPNEMG